ncbi:alpha/beta-hydrolase [Acrodontium crateriforme]|uniref:Carboxylic ester hydrolase n=1 Tax=Acrodontium crateriforme TaxID=150365 RepID=A0AAQ3MAR7_9PEZI|nr:alpha/beta-hydrolase [Acrodontium crateriforme]
MKLSAFILCGLQSCPLAAGSNNAEAQPPTDELIVHLDYASYRGSHNGSSAINSWLGIQYASPPIGPLRFQAPQEPKLQSNLKEVISATSFENFAQCPQAGLLEPQADVGAEDCLYLSVQSPANASSLPVFVWIHGGGFQNGNGKIDFAPFIEQGQSSFVVVSIQYRLNTFGFLASPDVRQYGTLNAGLLDQKKALEWVQKYIHLFGGNARRVTIGGESAGAASIYYHTTALGGTLGNSLWTGSILSSAAVVKPYHFTTAPVVRPYYRLVNAVGCLSSQQAFNCLVDAPFETLQNASNLISISEIYSVPPFNPVVDDDTYLLTSPSDQLQRGPINGAFALVGNQANEGFDFVPIPSIKNPLFPLPLNTSSNLQAYVEYLFPLLSPGLAQQAISHYSNLKSLKDFSFDDNLAESLPHEIAINILGETTFYCPSEWLSLSLQKAWRYQFAIPPALHASDLAIYEPTNITGNGNPGQNISNSFRSAFLATWTSFINTWDPSSSDAIRDWPLFTAESPLMLNFNTTGATVEATYELGGAKLPQAVGGTNNFSLVNEFEWQGGRGSRCDFWRGLGRLLPT